MADDREKVIRDYPVLTPQAINPVIIRLEVQADNFEHKPVMFHMLQTVRQSLHYYQKIIIYTLSYF